MENSIDMNQLISAIAKRLALEIASQAELPVFSEVKRRLLTVEQAATYMGRTEEAMQHLVASGKVPTVRVDRRVFVDVRDLDRLIDLHKRGGTRSLP